MTTNRQIKKNILLKRHLAVGEVYHSETEHCVLEVDGFKAEKMGSSVSTTQLSLDVPSLQWSRPSSDPREETGYRWTMLVHVYQSNKRQNNP